MTKQKNKPYTKLVEKQEGIYKSRKQIFVNNFIGGIGWAFGATIGISLLLALWGFILHRINLVPVVGNFILEVIKFVLQNNPNLIK